MEVLTYFISLFQILNLSTHGLHFFLGGFPFPPDSHTPCPSSWAFLFPPGFSTPSPGPLGPSLSSRILIPCSGPHGCLLFPSGYQPPAPGFLEGVPIFICDFTRHLVFSEASLMLSFPVRQRFEQGVKNCLTKCALAAPRLLL